MAVAAETFEQIPQHTAEIYVFPQLIDHERLGLSADELPWLRTVREQAGQEAARILLQRKEDLVNGYFERVPLDVDAVSTAEKAAAVAEYFGKDSPEYATARQALATDYSRKWAEATRKNTYEYFGVDKQVYDNDSDTLFADGFSVDEMLENGLTPLTEPEETQIRKNDYIAHQAKKAILKSPDGNNVGVVRVTPCPDWAIRSYRENPKRAHGGYAPEVEKLMVHYEWFDQNEGAVYHEQIGICGTHITPSIITQALRELGSNSPLTSKIDIHAEQVMVNKDSLQNGFELVALMDQLATEATGRNIFMGEEVSDNTVKDYTDVIEQAAERKKQQELMGEELADYVEQLHESGADHAWATVQVENYIHDRLLGLSENDLELARTAFDERTAHGFNLAHSLETQGRFDEAQGIRLQTRLEAPAASSCGAGSCGLESVKEGVETNMVNKLLDVRSDEKTLKDSERACKNCGRKDVYYAFNSSVVKKGCGSCGKVEHNGRQQRPKSFMIFGSSNNKKEVKL